MRYRALQLRKKPHKIVRSPLSHSVHSTTLLYLPSSRFILLRCNRRAHPCVPRYFTQPQAPLRDVHIYQCYCTDSRPRARWYQLRGLPLVGSECVFPQCNSSFVITPGKCQAIGVRPSRPSLKSSLETQTEKVELPSQ